MRPVELSIRKVLDSTLSAALCPLDASKLWRRFSSPGIHFEIKPFAPILGYHAFFVPIIIV